MAFVPGFKNDIFISYAHADNTEGWVDNFELRLRNRLQQFERNAGVAIWRDPKLRGADLWSEEIETQLRTSAVLVSLLSPNGLESNWCQQERQRFEQAAARTGGFRIDNAIRAFKVTKTPLPSDRHRSVFDTLGYEFYERLPNGRFTEFYPGTREFETVFDQFTQDVWERLNQLRTRALSPAPALTVYVASVPGDLGSWREAIVQQLAAWSCRVLPEDPLPRASPRLRGAIDEALASCRLSIHCVGATRGFIAEGEESPVDVLQLERARVTGIDRIVFRDATLHAGIKSVLEIPAAAGFEERITAPRIDVLLQALEDRIRSLRTSPAAGRTLPKVFVICDLREWDTALRIKACLEAERRYAALLPIRDVDDERVRIRDLRRFLSTSDAVLVYWGAARELWFRDQLREVIAAQKKRRGKLRPLCVSSPPDPARGHFRLPDLPFEQVPNVECRTLRPLLRYLDPPANGGNG